MNPQRNRPEVLLIDDDEEVLEAYTQTLQLDGFAVRAFASLAQAEPHISKEMASVVLTDVKMPVRDGFSVLRIVQEIDAEIPVVLISGHADVTMALNAMKAGAFDFVEKPADPAFVLALLRRAHAHRDLVLSHRRLSGAVRSKAVAGRILGVSPSMLRLRDQILALAQVDATVLICGETGTGKELVARGLQEFGTRAKGPFIAINCAALPQSIIESELFGHETGAFTGAKERRIGKIELADKGTLFLDEIESMPIEAQVRLLRVLQERRLERVGGTREVAVDIRIVSATKADLLELSKSGRFREDLAFRLDVVRLEVPSLRERGPSDVELLFRHFFAEAAARAGRQAKPLGDLTEILTYSWPGNVRELRNAAERAALGFPALACLTFGQETDATDRRRRTLAERMRAYERRELELALAQGKLLQVTAAELGISRKTLYLKLKEHGLSTAEDSEA